METEIIGGTVLALVSAALGWAVSQATVGRKVAEAISKITIDLDHTANEVHRSMDDVRQLREDTTSRIIAMTNMVNKVLETADKLIDVVQVQNALIAKQNEMYLTQRGGEK